MAPDAWGNAQHGPIPGTTLGEMSHVMRLRAATNPAVATGFKVFGLIMLLVDQSLILSMYSNNDYALVPSCFILGIVALVFIVTGCLMDHIVGNDVKDKDQEAIRVVDAYLERICRELPFRWRDFSDHQRATILTLIESKQPELKDKPLQQVADILGCAMPRAQVVQDEWSTASSVDSMA